MCLAGGLTTISTMNDNRFNSDVYFNVQTGDFESLSFNDSTNKIVISDPDTKEELERVSEDIFDPDLYAPVSDSAIEDPTQYYLGHLKELVEEKDVSIDARIAFDYCREQIEVIER